jgi:carboxypeptidase family protein
LGGDGWPPDTNGDVGPVYYLQTVNTSLGIFRKSDGALMARLSFDQLMSQGDQGNLCDTGNFGDPVVVWDSAADRWIVSDFAFTLNAQGDPMTPFYQCFAVSRTGDPLTGGWYFYSLKTTDYFPDYPKLGVWPDGLYLTANLFRANNSFRNVRVWALNKAQMYAGAGANSVLFNLPTTIQGVPIFTGLPSTYHGVTGTPPAGRPNLISVIYSGNVARVWKFHVDWNSPSSSTLTGPSNVTLASWGVAPSSVPAKNGNSLDTLRERLMVQSQYTNIGGIESLWLTHTVANPGNSGLAAPRWYQLNVTGGNVVTSGPLQQSTWAPDSTVSRWMASLAVDKNGNMAIGYSAASSTLFPAIRYAGRLASDPASTLGQSETSLVEGTASQCCNFSNGSINNRWGDYSAMTIDPDGCTFWYTNEYYQSPQPTTLAQDNWQTRIGSFKFPDCTSNSGAVQGTVIDSATSSPINGATVTAGSSSTTTDGSGQYTLTSLAAGTYTVTASAQGYTSGSASVTVNVNSTTFQNFALVASAAANTALAVASASGTYGGTTTLSATLTSSGTGVSGRTINFTLNGNPAGSGSTNGSGVATISGVSLSGIGAGTYPTGVGASFAGDASYGSSSGTNSLMIAKASQTITFGPLPSKTYGDPPFSVSATASSGMPVSFGASGNCSVSSATVTITGAGSCTLTASQPGDTNYLAATNIPQTFSIAKANQTITFGPLPNKTTSDPPFTVNATASSGLPVSLVASGQCTVSGNTVTITAAGSCTITASQAGNSNYNAAPSVPQSFTITAAGGGGASPDGTTIPPASQIVDNEGAVWTIGSNSIILRNGSSVLGWSGSKILWKNAAVYVLGTDSNWWQWTGGSWLNVGPSTPGGSGTSPSADGTIVPDTASQIVDGGGSVWTIGSNSFILRNGSSVLGWQGSKILWKNGSVYVLGTDSNWWQWTGSNWLNVGPTMPGGSSPTSPDGTIVPTTASQIVDNTGGVWTIGGNGLILRNGGSVLGWQGSKILWKNATIYVLGTDSNWWQWTGSNWLNVGPLQP